MKKEASEFVRVWEGEEVLPTYLPAVPERHPMFLERRVYQGSSGRVYPLPFTERIAEEPVGRRWRVVWLENAYVRVMILPELGGRIHAVQDRTNGYDLVYRQEVIKPALVGLAGPWVSGGIEFNWPQHHRPGTFLPVSTAVERGGDGSVTVWCGDHDPLQRMKGMHGVCLRPGRSVLEVRVRVVNRTPWVQTFLWWANVGVRAHDEYQSFFPPDVRQVADHAKRATSDYPWCRGVYYGVDYGALGVKAGGGEGEEGEGKGVDGAPNDLRFYRNLPTPCSYMAVGSRADFFGGYDHRARAGLVHVADHQVAPGKKQWTWGNHPFGWSWDRHLTDADAAGEFRPYLELMAGVYTDNQPDFSYLQPGEEKSWTQYWYPLREVGPVQQANLEGAVSVQRTGKRGERLRLGVCVTTCHAGAQLELWVRGRREWSARVDVGPDRPWVGERSWPKGAKETDLTFRVRAGDGRELVVSTPEAPGTGAAGGVVMEPATEPLAPEAVGGVDELYLIGVHLEQYRHATRCPTVYWREGLRRDAGDARCHGAMGRWHLRRGEWEAAERHFRLAWGRWTSRNGNPVEGQAAYDLGWCLRWLGWAEGGWKGAGSGDGSKEQLAVVRSRLEEAYAMLSKATWNAAWVGPGCLALAEMDAVAGRWEQAEAHLVRAQEAGCRTGWVGHLRYLVGRRRGGQGAEETEASLRRQVERDPLDGLGRWLLGEGEVGDWQERLDAVHDLVRAGLLEEALRVLELPAPARGDLPDLNWGSTPMVGYTRGWLLGLMGREREARAACRAAAAAEPDHCFPARLEEILVLEDVMRREPGDARAPYYLGNLLYDRRRHEDAMRCWERSARLDPTWSGVWRNLGMGWYNVRGDGRRARGAYERAVKAGPGEARLWYERDQLWKRLGVGAQRRWREMARRPELVRARDDLRIEWGCLCVQVGRWEEAREVLRQGGFQPWEGGEGLAVALHTRVHLAMGQRCLVDGDAEEARGWFEQAWVIPEGLGETRHLLSNPADVHYWLGLALDRMGKRQEAREHWEAAAGFRGDFQDMSVRTYSEATYYQALSLGCLGRVEEKRDLLRSWLAEARRLERRPARVDYFATSLPSLLLFTEDADVRQGTTVRLWRAQAWWGLGQRSKGRALLREVLERDPHHPVAVDLERVWGWFSKRKGTQQ